MIARKGKKVAWHFAHKDGNPGALETYLHNTGKYLFKQVFEASDKFTISLQAPAVCVYAGDCPVEERYPCHFKDYTTFDLKVYYDKCEIEKDFTVGNDTFCPDVLLLPKNAKHDPIFVEIEVTHASMLFRHKDNRNQTGERGRFQSHREVSHLPGAPNPSSRHS